MKQQYFFPFIRRLFILLMFLNVPFVCPAEEAPDWYRAQSEVVSTQMTGQQDFFSLAERMRKLKPENGQQAMFKLGVLMRAGLIKDAGTALRELKTLHPGLDNYQISGIYYEACDNLLLWDTARDVVEVFAENISELSLDNRLLKHFLASGWSVDDVDRWLRDKPAGLNGFWTKERLRFNMKHGRGIPLVQELAGHVKANPRDIQAAVAFLDALLYARYDSGETWDLSWLSTTIHPERASEAEALGSRLKRLSEYQAAADFFHQAVTLPLTDEETRQRAMMYQAIMSEEAIRAGFSVQVRESLAECLLELGRNEEAQKWMVEAADIRGENSGAFNALLAGEVQAASGARTIETRLQRKEELSEDDPEYWFQRARYYQGRKDAGQEEEALKKGLELTSPQPEAERRFKGHFDYRSQMVSSYALFLKRMRRMDEAVAFLRREMEQFPAEMASTKAAGNLLAFELFDRLSADDPVLWEWLARRPQWQYTEERLLWRMLEKAQRQDIHRYFEQAEKLALGKDPSRMFSLGWIMNRMQFAERSIPLLALAIEKADDAELKGRAVFTLLESYLDTNNWKKAEEIFPEASQRLTPAEVSKWLGRIAVVAAQSGERAEAIRIWTAVANINPYESGAIDSLLGLGLREELIDFYQQMGQKMPASEIPVKMLKHLQQK